MLRATGKQAASAALQKKGASQQPSPQQGTTGTAKLAGDIGRADSTKGADASAMKLFDHFLIEVFGGVASSDLDPSYLEDGGIEQLGRAYAKWLADTNIPLNFEKYLNDSSLVPSKFLKYTTLSEYLGKALNLLEKICPDDPLWKDDGLRGEFSGSSFKKACQRSQQQKSDTFGQEAKLALYRTARHGDGETTAAPPHWMNLVNVEDVAKNMLRETKIGDDAAGLAAKRLAVVLTKHGVGRGGEVKYLDTAHFKFDPFLMVLDTTWTEQKTLNRYSCPFVPNKDEPYSDVFHALGAYVVVERGLYRQQSDDGKGQNTHLFPQLRTMAGSGASRWQTAAIQKHLSDAVPKEERKKVTAKSSRIGSITEMGAMNVGFYPSHARSGHTVGTNQENYFDRSDPSVSLSAAKALAGWVDFGAFVHPPNLRCLGVEKEITDGLIKVLVNCSLPDFLPNGRLYPIIEICIASLIMYDVRVSSDLGTNNAVSLALRNGFKAANVLDPRASCGTSTGALKCWSELIWNDFRSRNPDFQPLTNASNSIQVINTLNQQSTFLSQCMNELADVKRQNILLQSLIEEERGDRKKIVSFIKKMGSIYNMPQSPPPPKKRKTGGNNESAASTPVQLEVELEKNYNNIDADQLHGGTALHNIISGAYKQGLLNDGFIFSGLERPGRFTDNAKYKHCLDLLDAVVEDDEKEFLCKKGHSDQALEDKVRSISRRALDLLKRLEGNPEKGNHTDGYTGVGSRAQKIKTGRGVSSMKEAMERNTQSSLKSHFIRKSGGSK